MFEEKARLHTWLPKLTMAPSNFKFNDTVTIPHYETNDSHLFGKQRKGISTKIDTCSGHLMHLETASQLSYPFSSPTPIPEDLRDSVNLMVSATENDIRNFWQRQLDRFSVLAEHTSLISSEWYDSTPVEIQGATGTIDVALLSTLMRRYGMGDGAWASQFVHGFPITGVISQAHTFPCCPPPDDLPGNPNLLFDTSKKRFVGRSKKSPTAHLSTVWAETMKEVSKGWLGPPREVKGDGTLVGFPLERINFAFRFPVVQIDKIRCCDDLLHAQTNQFCRIDSPITLPSWDLVAEICLSTKSSGIDWCFGKVDHCSAYKNLPIRPSDQRFSYITIKNPSTGRFVAMAPKTQISGSIASVLHYNVLSRILVSIFNRVFGIPMIGYFDDFGFLIPSSLSSDALQLVHQVCQMLGVKLKPDKSSIGRIATFLGLRGSFTHSDNDFTLTISLPNDKRVKWQEMLAGIIASRRVTHAALESIIGRLGFAQCSIYSKFARTMLQPLYAKLYAKPYYLSIHGRTLDVIRWWWVALDKLPPRSIKPRNEKPDFILYTDASYENGSGVLAAVLFDNSKHIEGTSRVADKVLRADASSTLLDLFTDTSIIFGLELSAVTLSIFKFREIFKGKSILIFVDNNAVLGAIVKGQTPVSIAHCFLSAMWLIASESSFSIWFERVASIDNIADVPTRNGVMPLPVLKYDHFPPSGSVARLCEWNLFVILEY